MPTSHAVVSPPIRSVCAAIQASAGSTRALASTRPASSSSAGATMSRQ